MRFLRFLFATVIYIVIDVGWNFSPVARGMYARLHEASGNDWSYGKQIETWGGVEVVGLIVFFLLMRARQQLPGYRTCNPERRGSTEQ